MRHEDQYVGNEPEFAQFDGLYYLLHQINPYNLNFFDANS